MSEKMLVETEDLEWRWFVVRTKPKAEHMAARQLEKLQGLETLAPRLSYMKSTRRGRVRWYEPMFPGYCMVRFDWREHWRLVNASMGVAGVVRFDRMAAPPSLAAELVEDLRERCGEGQLVELDDGYEVGEQVEVRAGPLCGMEALVTRVLPRQQRVSILMEMLGDVREVELPMANLASRRRLPAQWTSSD